MYFNKIRKIADKHSDSFIRDAIKGLSDQYAKAYYDGLKSSYNYKPERTKADYNELYRTTEETGHSLIESSYPDSLNAAEAMGDGGLVENSVQKHKKLKDIAQNVPSGNLRSKY